MGLFDNEWFYSLLSMQSYLSDTVQVNPPALLRCWIVCLHIRYVIGFGFIHFHSSTLKQLVFSELAKCRSFTGSCRLESRGLRLSEVQLSNRNEAFLMLQRFFTIRTYCRSVHIQAVCFRTPVSCKDFSNNRRSTSSRIELSSLWFSSFSSL